MSLTADNPNQKMREAEAPNRNIARTGGWLAMSISPINERRLANFRRNRRGVWSLRLFLIVFIMSLFAELIANDRPLIVSFDDKLYFPFVVIYPETTFNGEFETEADYRDEFVIELIEEGNGWILWPPVRFSHDTINYDLPVPAPAPPLSLIHI